MKGVDLNNNLSMFVMEVVEIFQSQSKKKHCANKKKCSVIKC